LKTSLECLVCFYRQGLTTAQLSSDNIKVQHQVLRELGTLLPSLDRELSPPENAVFVYSLIAKITGEADPFAELKLESNNLALGLQQQTKNHIITSPDPLFTALRYAIAGNIIDYGAQHDFNPRESLAKCVDEDFIINDYEILHRKIRESPTPLNILYLADNCGELVFDGLLVEQLLAHGCNIRLAVRGKTILNDVTLDDAAYCSINQYCQVIDNGTGCPGTPLAVCSQEFQQHFAEADLIISKGQGNFETLSDVDAPLFFLLTVKCSVVARHITQKRGLAMGIVTGSGKPILMQQTIT